MGDEEGATSHPIHGIPPPQSSILDSNVAENWRFFKQNWQNYAVITNLDKQKKAYQVSLFLYTFGEAALIIYNGFNFTIPESGRTVGEIIAKFDCYAICDVNQTYERFILIKRVQKEGETLVMVNLSVQGKVIRPESLYKLASIKPKYGRDKQTS